MTKRRAKMPPGGDMTPTEPVGDWAVPEHIRDEVVRAIVKWAREGSDPASAHPYLVWLAGRVGALPNAELMKEPPL